METRQFGATDMRVSVLGFGAAEIGFERVGVEDARHLLNTALDNGLNVIDTAECYDISEELLGQTLSHRRSEFFLFTKCGHKGFDQELPEDVRDAQDWDPQMLRASIERSLKRLQTDCVDLIQLHSCDKEILERGDVIRVLEDARQAGKTRYIGYSGDREAALYAVECGRFDALQTSCSIADQEAIDALIPNAQSKNMGVVIKRPIANAVWRYATKDDAPEYHQEYLERLQVLDYPFSHGQAQEITATALRFPLSIPGVHTAIAGTTKANRWRENADLLQAGNLSSQEYEAIRARWKEVAGADWTARS
jgi:aryl-alcohol dehydrogenase-like predicted oxidoreductase